MFDERLSQAGSERPTSYKQESVSDVRREKAKSKTSHRRHSEGMLVAVAHYPKLI